MTDWSGVEGPVLPADMWGAAAREPWCGYVIDETGERCLCTNEGNHTPGGSRFSAEGYYRRADARALRYGVDYTLGERTGPYPLRDLLEADAAQACGAVRVLGGANSEYLTCELWPEHEGSHVRVTDRHRFYTWTEEETEQPRDPWADSRAAGLGRVQDERGDNEVYLRTGPTVGRVENYSYGNGHLSAQLIIGGVEYLLALQVEEPA